MLEVRGLLKRYGRAVAVDQLDFDVRPGELLAMIGPNGAGKSTTLNCLAGLLRPDGGTITWHGTALGPDRGRTISLIPETPFVYQMLTVWEHLVFVARGAGITDGWRERAEDLLRRFDLEAQRDKLGEALSKGMRQKLLVACGILGGAPVLMLDEPMVGLDPKGQRELRGMLEQLRADGRALVVSSHLLGYLDGFADRVLIMKEGRTLAFGTVAELRGETDRPLEEIFLELTA
jgi:ABC-type multidrug transport system ATPase subunit